MVIFKGIDNKERLTLELIGFDKETRLYEYEIRLMKDDYLAKFYQGWEAGDDFRWIITWLNTIGENPFSNLEMDNLPLKFQFHHSENACNYYLLTFSNYNMEDSESKFEFEFIISNSVQTTMEQSQILENRLSELMA